MADLTTEMEQRAANAIREIGGAVAEQLDYSPASLAVVDQLFRAIREDAKRSPAGEVLLVVHYLNFTGYVGEVIRRNLGGFWTNPQEGPPVLSFGDKIVPIHAAVFAVLNEKQINMGGTMVSTLTEYYAFLQNIQQSWVKREA